jgi:hypothetical protein
LYPAPGPRITLDLYPGDTLEQARELYGDRSRVEHLLALRERGWRLEPNFHFGFMTKGLTWTRSSLSADEYTDYWVKRIDGLGAFPPEDWEQELGRLIADGIFHPADRPQFDADFTNTNRKHATPRPGLRLTQAWPHTHALSEGFAEELREALMQALHALGEYQATADLRPSSP